MPENKLGKKITRRDFSKGVAATAAGITLATSTDLSHAKQMAKSSSHKNVLIIMMDQERAWATLPKGLNLPVREKFASEGVSFEEYNIATLSCAPSRSVIYTGQHVQQTTIFTNPGLGVLPRTGERGGFPGPMSRSRAASTR